MKSKYKSFIYSIAVSLLAISVLNKIYWIYICGQYTEFEETKTAYLSLFPEFLQNAFFLTVIEITALSAAIILFLESIMTGYLKKTSQILMILSAILCWWNIFSLM